MDLGPGHLFGNRSEGTGSPRNPSAENVRLRVGPYPRTTLITSNPTVVSGRFTCNTRTPKAYVFTTTTRIGIKRDPAKRPRSARPRRSLTPGRLEKVWGLLDWTVRDLAEHAVGMLGVEFTNCDTPGCKVKRVEIVQPEFSSPYRSAPTSPDRRPLLGRTRGDVQGYSLPQRLLTKSHSGGEDHDAP